MDKTLELSKDSAFETVVVSAEFDKDQGKWIVKTEDGRTTKAVRTRWELKTKDNLLTST